MTTQLYIDGEMVGPSHGDRAIPIKLPTYEQYDKTAEIRDVPSGLVIAKVQKMECCSRERFYLRTKTDGCHDGSPWLWRDTRREVTMSDGTSMDAYDRCDGEGTYYL